jgi:hypothetical protein
MSAALEKGHTMHLRCLWRRPQVTINLAIEDVFTDIINTLNTTDKRRGEYRTDASLKAYANAIPEDMRDVTWAGLNRLDTYRCPDKRPTPVCI